MRFDAHPLVRYDPAAVNGGIQVLKLEYFEEKTTVAPVPRNQEVPKEAFGKLTGRSILVVRHMHGFISVIRIRRV